MAPGWNLLLANCFSLGSFEIQIVNTEQQIRAEQVAAAARAGGLKFISKLWNPFMQKTCYLIYLVCLPLVVDPAEELAVPVVAAVDQGAVALGAEETFFVPRTVRKPHHESRKIKL